MAEEELKRLQSLHKEQLQKDDEKRAAEVVQDIRMLQAKANKFHLKDCADVYRNFYIQFGHFEIGVPAECSMIVQVPESEVPQKFVKPYDGRSGVLNPSQATLEKAKKVVETTNIELSYRGQSQQVKLTLVSGNHRRNDWHSGCNAEYCYKLSIGSDIALKK